MFIERDARSTLERLAAGFPVLWLTGPRQSGKTTLARAARPDLPYVNLERPDERDFARADPQGFLAAYPDGAILDEVQHVPELTSWLQVLVDADGRMGRWLLTGSAQPAIAAGVSQSLAGRVGRIELLPLSGHELDQAGLLPNELSEVLVTGGYPALFDRAVTPADWLGNYVATYVERDVRMLTSVRDLNTFTRFLRLCAGRSGQVLNMASLGNDTGISVSAVRQWLSILRATYVLDLMDPWSPNVTTRLVKSPKLVFLDVGLMAHLLGITEPAQVASHPLRGALFETWGITEQVKAWRNAGSAQRIMFLRDARGHEIDLIFPVQGRMQAVEFKSGATISTDWQLTSRLWQQRSREIDRVPVIVYGGKSDSRRTNAHFLSWRTYTRECASPGLNGL